MKTKKLIFFGTVLFLLCTLALLRVSAAGLTEAGKELQKYDLDEDGRITITDVTTLLNYLAYSCGHESIPFPELAPTCTEPGSTGGSFCKNCGNIMEMPTAIPATGHTEVFDEAVDPTCTETGLTEGAHCEKCGEVLIAQEPIKETGHIFSDWKTVKEASTTEEGMMERVCGCGEKETQTIEKISPELEYTLNRDGKSYSVTGIGTWIDAELIIPPMYNGKPVVAVGEDAFKHCSKLTSITIPDSVKSIEWGAFSGCSGLTIIDIPPSVTKIGNWAFSRCTKLTSVVISDSVTDVGECAFAYCSELTDIWCEPTSAVSGWDYYWKKYCDATVHWGGDWEYVDGVPTLK